MVRTSLLRVTLTLALPLAAAAPAVSAPFEQVSRGDGALGASPLPSVSYGPAAVGDVGRYVGYRREDEVTANGGLTWTIPNDRFNNIAWVRDVQANKNVDYGGGIRRVYGFDRIEHMVLLGRLRSGQAQVVVAPIGGGAARIIATYTPKTGAPWTDYQDTTDGFPDAALSGDGTKVILADASGVRRYDLKTAQFTELSQTGNLHLGWNAVSDDGLVVLTRASKTAKAELLRDGTSRILPADRLGASFERLSTSGRFAAWMEVPAGAGLRIAFMDTRAGSVRFFTTPREVDVYMPRWISPDGTQIVVGPGGDPDVASDPTTHILDTTSAAGTWTTYPGRFGGSLSGNDLGSIGSGALVAPGGRFAAVRAGANQVALVDLTGAHIVGANEPFSAAAYVNVDAYHDCFSGNVQLSLHKAASWAPLPVSATVKLTSGSTVLASGMLSGPPLRSGDDGIDPTASGPQFLTVPWPAALPGLTTATLTATITDDRGRTFTESAPVDFASLNYCPAG